MALAQIAGYDSDIGAEDSEPEENGPENKVENEAKLDLRGAATLLDRFFNVSMDCVSFLLRVCCVLVCLAFGEQQTGSGIENH
eukprot:m.49161 g.49161  ORF g.49161 m.49161 type:complete len:83 (-) comp11459_c0_seq1:344-592(-)